MHFEKKTEAEQHFKQYITLFEAQNGQGGTVNWAQEDAFVKLKAFADGCIAQMNEAEEEEGYYDEEEDTGDIEGK